MAHPGPPNQNCDCPQCRRAVARQAAAVSAMPVPPPERPPWRCRVFGHAWRKGSPLGRLWAYCDRCPAKLKTPKAPELHPGQGIVIEPTPLAVVSFNGKLVADAASYSIDHKTITLRGARFDATPKDVHEWKSARDDGNDAGDGTFPLLFAPPSASGQLALQGAFVYAFSVDGDALRHVALMNGKGWVVQVFGRGVS